MLSKLSRTPGLNVKSLKADSASAFEYVVTDGHRVNPIVVISATASGEFLVDAERVRSLVAGLAEVVQIPAGVDTFALAELIGKENIAWLGAVRILFPPRSGTSGRFVPRTLLLADKLLEITEEGNSPENEILFIVAHSMNLTNSRAHIRPESVRDLKLRREIQRRRQEAEAAGSTAELLPLYEAADAENTQKIRQLEDWNLQLESMVEALEDEKRSLSARHESLTASLAKALPTENDSISKSRDGIAEIISRGLTPENSLKLLELLYPERVVILESAWKSARESASFKNQKKMFELLRTLVTSYWQSLVNGEGDSEARRVFGNAYAAHESESAEANKRSRELRTFTYEGRPIEMWKHLKIGIKPSLTETLRIHFEWDAIKRTIVIGHCGAHLDHG